uniref:Uncharacterized protein n=1 Tax=Arundo donax TaxID=35708 RepID=A0A0A8Y6M3_ARUDO
MEFMGDGAGLPSTCS